MLDFSPEKMIFIFFIVLIVLGPEKLPEISRKMGRAMAELRRLSGGFRAEMDKAMNEVTREPPPEKSESTPRVEAPSDTGSPGDSDGSTEN